MKEMFRVKNITIEISNNGIWFSKQNKKTENFLTWISKTEFKEFSFEQITNVLKNSLPFKQI